MITKRATTILFAVYLAIASYQLVRHVSDPTYASWSHGPRIAYSSNPCKFGETLWYVLLAARPLLAAVVLHALTSDRDGDLAIVHRLWFAARGWSVGLVFFVVCAKNYYANDPACAASV